MKFQIEWNFSSPKTKKKKKKKEKRKNTCGMECFKWHHGWVGAWLKMDQFDHMSSAMRYGS